jgi:tRNA modification GTPase
VTSFPAPASYTGDDVVEISAHGSQVVLNAIVATAVAAGARLAAPGEFTLREFLNGKVDLPQAEAVADLIEAATPLQAATAFDQLSGTLTSAISAIDADLFDLIARLEASIDFPEEGYHFVEPVEVERRLRSIVGSIESLLTSSARGRLLREGLLISIVGRRNVGKSSLFNALVGAHRAIVTDIAGTTRDLLTEVVDLRGLRVTLVDTAGLGETDDPIEREGILRARETLKVADVILLVCDDEGSWQQSQEVFHRRGRAPVVVVASKTDLPEAWLHDDAVAVSAQTGQGIESLLDRIHQALGGESLAEMPAITNVRHIDLLRRTRDTLREAVNKVEQSGQSLSEEFVLSDLQIARGLLEEVTGQRTADDVLTHIFERFCIGK